MCSTLPFQLFVLISLVGLLLTTKVDVCFLLPYIGFIAG